MPIGRAAPLAVILASLALVTGAPIRAASSGEPRPGPELDPATASGRMADALNNDRHARGAFPLQRPAALQRAAEERARFIATLPAAQRMNREPRIAAFLEQRGLQRYAQVRERLVMVGGYSDPVEAVLEEWRALPDAWAAAMAPSAGEIGIGWARTGDGWTVFLAILVDPLPRRGAQQIERMERTAFDAVNAVRRQQGLPDLKWDAAAADVARHHSADMAARRYFDHRSPEGDAVGDRLRVSGIAFRVAGENIAMSRGADDPAFDAVRGWRASPGHLRNMLQPDYQLSGLGVAEAEDGSLYFTQVFLRPPGP